MTCAAQGLDFPGRGQARASKHRAATARRDHGRGMVPGLLHPAPIQKGLSGRTAFHGAGAPGLEGQHPDPRGHRGLRGAGRPRRTRSGGPASSAIPTCCGRSPAGRGRSSSWAERPARRSAAAIAFLREHIRVRGYTMRDEVAVVEPEEFDPEAALVGLSRPSGPVPPRLIRFLPIRFGVEQITEMAGTGNLSETGLFIITNAPEDRHAWLNMMLEVDGDSIGLQGLVRWMNRRHRAGRSPGMGVQLELPPPSYWTTSARSAESAAPCARRRSASRPSRKARRLISTIFSDLGANVSRISSSIVRIGDRQKAGGRADHDHVAGPRRAGLAGQLRRLDQPGVGQRARSRRGLPRCPGSREC